ncbi:NADPH:quinone reductase [Rhodovastum atsumiense]|uniref:NADPH:quinone reductase n=1 Tax=Rhodovastum atsumiense TaxID=504468 RepID=A0A5M6J1X2_9PROT|nr:NADPH:quinone reductase [Rhodovastum atsumiense]KAA5614600.1 NADPH:quinone reductase [Rhodovastum atsumiense]CAH2599903.1 NADPH:quinone reductase [Rhodovastum atsumiense]
MRAAWYERTGAAREVLILGELPTPSPGPGEVLVRLVTSGVNPSDWKTRGGSRPMVGPRVIPHSDGAGTVEAVGEGVDAGRIGERVWIWNGQWKRPFGTAAEFIALPAAQAVRLPEATDFEAGACLGIPALTAWRAVQIDGGVAGQSVLVAGGAGAVGHYAIQMAKLLGARQVLATVSSAAKAAHARVAGADEVIDYRTEDVASRVAMLTGGRGVDRVVEVDLAANAALLPQVVARDGCCVCYGSGRPEVALPFGPMILSGAAVRFFIVYELSPAARAEGLARLTHWLEEGRLQHAIGRVLPLSEIVTAHELVERGEVSGNVVLRP